MSNTAETNAVCLKCDTILCESLLCGRERTPFNYGDNGTDWQEIEGLSARYEGICLRCCTHTLCGA